MNEHQNLKKREEQFFIDTFLKVAKIDAEIIETDREKPDFLIRVEGRVIGVEVTKVFISDDRSPKPLQVQESISSQIVSKARELYRVSGGPPLSVNVVFRPNHDLSGMSKDASAAALVAFINKLEIPEGQSINWRPEEIISPLPNEISFVHARRVPQPDMAHWGVAGAGWTATLSSPILQKRIDAKAKLLPDYLKAADTHWLLMVANQTNPSQLFRLPENMDDLKIQSPFSRTFFYPYPESRFFELVCS